VIDESCGFGFALRGLNFRLKDAATSMLGNKFEGMKYRLAPSPSARFRKNGPDDVHQLSQASHFDPIGVVQQRDKGPSNHQGILEIVDLFN
jgi:hypothetical protein